jgi:hypothetical protein
MNHGKRLTKLGLAAAIGLGMGDAHAVPQAYTNFSDFELDLASSGLVASRQGFDDGIAADTVINEGATIGGFTFSNIKLESGELAVVELSDPTETRSQFNAIGTDVPAEEQMRNPDSFTLTFPTPSYAFGIWFIAESEFAANDDFSLTLPGSPSQVTV